MAVSVEYNPKNNVPQTKTVIMATKAANRIKDKWAEQGFEISESQPYVDSCNRIVHDWSMLLTKWYKHSIFPDKIIGQDTINITYHEFSNPNTPNYTISSYHHSKDSEVSEPFYWNEHLLSLLNEQINCIDDAICILEHSEEMLVNG